MRPTGAALVAGVVGAPVAHSLSPLLHNLWIEAAGIDAAYAPFPGPDDALERFVEGMRGGAVTGVNVTAPFKERALAAADIADEAAQSAGAANLLLFRADGVVAARNTDGEGLLAALAGQAPTLKLRGAVVALIGAGGAARGAATTLLQAGVSEVRIVNRTFARARTVSEGLDGAMPYPLENLRDALSGAHLVVNAASGGTEEMPALAHDWRARSGGAALDMSYRPLRTPFLKRAAEQGLTVVDGLEMLIGQARPSFEAFYGVAAPAIDVRAQALAALGEAA